MEEEGAEENQHSKINSQRDAFLMRVGLLEPPRLDQTKLPTPFLWDQGTGADGDNLPPSQLLFAFTFQCWKPSLAKKSTGSF